MRQALLIFIIFQSLLFSILLISGRKRENRYMTIYFSYLFLFHLAFLLSDKMHLFYPSYDELVGSIYEFIALCNSAIVFSFLYSILGKPMPRPFYLLWLLPIAHTITAQVFKTVNADLYGAGFYKNWYLNFPFYTKILYTLLLIGQIRVFKKEIAENAQSKEHIQVIKLYWGKYFVYFQVISCSLLLIYLAFTLTNGKLYTVDSDLFVYSADYYNLINRSCMIFFLLVFGYLALRNPEVFNTVNSVKPNLEQQLAEFVLPKDEKNFQPNLELPAEQMKEYEEKLGKLMEEQKLYLDASLTLNKFAQLADVPPRKLSLFLNLTCNKNFKEYINGYRVEYAKKMLTDNNSARFTMYSIAYDSGFNAESTFYLVFKQQTGLTPKQYQDSFKADTQNC